MKISKTKAWLIGSIPGIILLGIVTNALWEYIKLSSNGILLFLVRITTLGISKLNDGIYIEIARGLHESMSLQMYTLFIAFIISIVILSATLFFTLKKKIIEGGKNEYKENAIIKRFIKGKFGFYFFIIYSVFCITFFAFDVARNVYINEAVSYYNQLILIIDPEIDVLTHKIFDSRFSQIKNGEDYNLLINDLEELIKSKNFKLPKKPSMI